MFEAILMSTVPLTFLIEEGKDRKFACYLKAGKITDRVRDFSEEDIKAIYAAAFERINLIKAEMDKLMPYHTSLPSDR